MEISASFHFLLYLSLNIPNIYRSTRCTMLPMSRRNSNDRTRINMPRRRPLETAKETLLRMSPTATSCRSPKEGLQVKPSGTRPRKISFLFYFFHIFSPLSHFDFTSPRLKRADSISFQSFRCGGSSSSTEMRMADKTSKKLMAIAIIFTYRGNHAISHLLFLSFRKKKLLVKVLFDRNSNCSHCRLTKHKGSMCVCFTSDCKNKKIQPKIFSFVKVALPQYTIFCKTAPASSATDTGISRTQLTKAQQ